jgi:predicted GTPase
VTSGSLFSCTQEVHAFGCLRPGRSDQKIIIVDTPGFDDTKRTDYEVLEGIAKWLETT